jgi:hypothetical protein
VLEGSNPEQPPFSPTQGNAFTEDSSCISELLDSLRTYRRADKASGKKVLLKMKKEDNLDTKLEKLIRSKFEELKAQRG